MKHVLGIIALVVVLSAPAIAQSTADDKPAVSVRASAATSAGEPKSFKTPYGDVAWAPSIPLYVGDRLTVTYDPSAPMQPYCVTVSLDGRPVATLEKAPWQTVIDTSNLKPGRHVVNGDVRFTGSPRKYSIVEFAFSLQEPGSEIKGLVETNAASPAETADNPTIVAAEFVAPTAGQIDQSFVVSLHATDPTASRAIRAGEPVRVGRSPITLYLLPAVGVDRWAYSIDRDGRQLSGAGSIPPMVGVEVASKGSTGEGLLPGTVRLTAWGIRSNGVYSRPVVTQLVVQ